jgi:hypothetical protein
MILGLDYEEHSNQNHHILTTSFNPLGPLENGPSFNQQVRKLYVANKLPGPLIECVGRYPDGLVSVLQGILIQEVIEGQGCLNCEDACPGFTQHPWR